MSTEILSTERAGIGILTLNRPEALNAWTMAMQAELAEEFRRLDADDRIRAIILTGSGERAFCAGQDLAESAELSAEKTEDWLENFRNLYESVLGVSKPVVAALNGVAAGSGYQVSLLCDVRVAHSEVRMGQPEVSSGIPSITGMYLSERALGSARMLDLMLSGRLMEIDELVSVGLVQHVVEQDRVLDAALDVATRLADQPSVAVALTKERYRQTVLPGLREAFAAAVEIDRKAWASGQPQQVMRDFFAARAAKKS